MVFQSYGIAGRWLTGDTSRRGPLTYSQVFLAGAPLSSTAKLALPESLGDVSIDYWPIVQLHMAAQLWHAQIMMQAIHDTILQGLMNVQGLFAVSAEPLQAHIMSMNGYGN